MNRLLAQVLVLVLTAPAAGAAQDNLTIVRATPPANPASAENFTGTARVGEIFRGDEPARVYGATVAFEAGARTHWHAHALGQTLVVTSGTGLVQLWGGAVQEVRTGDVVLIPPRGETLARRFHERAHDPCRDRGGAGGSAVHRVDGGGQR